MCSTRLQRTLVLAPRRLHCQPAINDANHAWGGAPSRTCTTHQDSRIGSPCWAEGRTHGRGCRCRPWLGCGSLLSSCPLGLPLVVLNVPPPAAATCGLCPRLCKPRPFQPAVIVGGGLSSPGILVWVLRASWSAQNDTHEYNEKLSPLQALYN